MSTQTRCRAKNPATCTYHTGGRILSPDKEFYVQRMEQAQIDMDFEAYGAAYAAFKELDAVEVAAPRVPQPAKFANLLADALELAEREKPALVRERALLFARVPNEVEGQIVLDFFKKHKRNTVAVAESKNPYMYRVIAGALARYQPNAEIAQVIAESDDHRARLLLAANMGANEHAVKGYTNDVIRTLAADKDPEIRAHVARTETIINLTRGNSNDRTVTNLVNDPAAEVRLALANNQHLSREHLEMLRQDNNAEVAQVAAEAITAIDQRTAEYQQWEEAHRREIERRRADGTLAWYDDPDYDGPGSGYDARGVYHPSEDDR